MKKSLVLSLAAMLLAGGLSLAAELKSGLEVGKAVGPFDVVKCGGAADDGVDVGDRLCYRCKYSNRPMEMVFANKVDDNVTSMVKKLDAAVAKHADKQLKAFVDLLGENREELETKAKEFSQKSETAKIPFVVPVEFESGPGDYGLNPEGTVTVIVANKGKVVANHAFAAADLNDKSIEEVLADVTKIVK